MINTNVDNNLINWKDLKKMFKNKNYIHANHSKEKDHKLCHFSLFTNIIYLLSFLYYLYKIGLNPLNLKILG